MAEQNSATKLKEARAARTAAKVELLIARENLEQIKKALATLEAEKRRIHEQRDRNEVELRRLDAQLRERRREEESIAAQVRRLNEQIDGIRGTEGRSDERARAESRLADLTTRLDEIREEIAGLETQERQARGRQTEIGARLQELDDKIKKKIEEKESAEKEVKSKEEDLDRKAADVAKAVREVKAAVVVDPLTHLKTSIRKMNVLLQAFGAAGVLYAYTLMAGFVHEWWLYCSNGLRVADYTVLPDFLLIPPVLFGVIFTIAIIPLGWGILLVPKISESVARCLCLLVGRPVLRWFVIGLGMVVLSLIGPGAAGYGTYYLSYLIFIWLVLLGVLLPSVIIILARRLLSIPLVSKSNTRILNLLVGHPVLRWFVIGLGAVGLGAAGYGTYNGVFPIPGDNEDTVTVLTDPPLQQAEKLVLVGSNSTYMFFKSSGQAGSDPPSVRAIPLSRIVCVGTDGCEAEAAELPGGSAGYSDYVAERLLPQFIGERMQCAAGTEPVISDFIRFVNDEPYPLCPLCPADAASAAGSIDDYAPYEAENEFHRKKIGPKVRQIVAEFSKKSPTRWTVFGFASPDGEEGKNDLLSENRARLVIDAMCGLRENGTPEPAIDCGEKEEERYADTQARFFGEWHPINGISNSRSAVIAACVPKTNG